MSGTVEIRGLDELLTYTQNLPAEMYNKAKGEYTSSAFALHRTMTQRVSGSALKRRTGQLARSFKVKVTGTNLKTLGASIATTSPYAPIHETGGIIRAKNAYGSLEGGPFLNIPSTLNKTAAGVTRQTAREVFNAGAYILKISAPKAKYVVLLGGKPMFWLVKEVEIKARLGMQIEADKSFNTLLSSLRSATQRGIE